MGEAGIYTLWLRQSKDGAQSKRGLCSSVHHLVGGVMQSTQHAGIRESHTQAAGSTGNKVHHP